MHDLRAVVNRFATCYNSNRKELKPIKDKLGDLKTLKFRMQQITEEKPVTIGYLQPVQTQLDEKMNDVTEWVGKLEWLIIEVEESSADLVSGNL